MKLFVFLVLVAVAFSSFFKKDSKIEVLTSKNFYEKVGKGKDKCVVMFFAKWCGYCKEMKPEYEKLANKIGDKVHFYAIEGDKAEKISEKEKIEGFPTFKIFTTDGKSKEYEGDLTVEEISYDLEMPSLRTDL